MRPQLLPLALALLAALPPGAQAGPEVTAEAGLSASLPCNLTGPELSWRWVPRYPRCAGGSGGIQTIYTVTAAGAHDAPEGRFQKRLRFLMDQGCPAGASIEMIPQGPVVEGASVSLSCSPCGAQGPTSPPAGGATWRLNGETLPNSTGLRILRAKVTIVDFSSRWEGLWSCRLPGDPPRSGGYCLERDPGAHGTQESPPPGPSPVSPGSAPGRGGGVTVLALRCGLAFLFLSASLGAVGFVHWRTRARPAGRPQRD
ncbi:uncharacterized protein LOC120392490 isoform X3 [Mauremys reevesii]|uniref:uncharacterized protein LOC120392490 isoform X3 n=1 Tax=Mauremys reevesii TaxID=260615 RepID=UPI00193ECF55|nr:uncharacterized protein LOC120392490 isoform X3 [Mauremys reevesii]